MLLFDARGHGESGGRAMDFGWFGDADIEPAVDYLLAAPDVSGERVALVRLAGPERQVPEQRLGLPPGERQDLPDSRFAPTPPSTVICNRPMAATVLES